MHTTVPATTPSTQPGERTQPAAPSGQQPLALVMGASRGLGLLCAEQFLQHGYRVVLSSRSRDSLEAARDQLLAEYPGATLDVAPCDISDRAAVTTLVEHVERDLAPIEVLLTVAGIIQVGPVQAMTLEHFDQAVSTMLMGPVNLTLQVLPHMRERGRGRIGTVTSVGGKVAPPHLLPYSTAKFGAVGFSEGLTAELAGTGITATTIVPGLMRTGSHDAAQFTGDVAREFAWFGPSASLPLLAMDAERAAERMVHGVLEGHTHVMLSPVTQVGSRVHGLAPSFTTRLMGLANRVLPTAPAVDPLGPGTTVEGRVARQGLTGRARRVVDALSTLGDRAGEQNNER
ncbi:Short-chain dehydrogenase [Kytococcus aerolatus]|uniref:Short-chain dehydrogenase n=2 Tax=Kytococcus TaxID=57499 RepID=A0A212T8T9_9MICO|nr:SDR family oxidoreductase [Kytococcus aerolatus]SNC62438.1 Short-chain dehydrogenase [Kytococcus aerolatus]